MIRQIVREEINKAIRNEPEVASLINESKSAKMKRKIEEKLRRDGVVSVSGKGCINRVDICENAKQGKAILSEMERDGILKKIDDRHYVFAGGD
jgi:hypothetical protein